MDRAVVALLDKVRQVARVVNVRVAQDGGVNLARVERKAAVAVRGLLAVALVEAAFEQQALAVDLDEIHGAGGGAGRAEEMDFHWFQDLKCSVFQKGRKAFCLKT